MEKVGPDGLYCLQKVLRLCMLSFSVLSLLSWTNWRFVTGPENGGLCPQDPHILARKFGDRWLYRTLGVGLHGREVHRRELENPRQRLYNAVTLTSLQRGRSLGSAKVSPPLSSHLQQSAPAYHLLSLSGTREW